MDYRITFIWTARAKIEYFKILNYLDKNWSRKEVQNFILLTENLIERISENPGMFKKSNKKDVYKGLIMKHISLFYKYKSNKKEITLLSF
jgi:plasmid stabilization system protein ParE